MSEASTSETFACPTCGSRMPWNGRFAGRKITCACGATSVVPMLPQADEYGMSAQAPPMHGGPRPPPSALRATPTPSGRAKPLEIEYDPDQDESIFRRVWLPLAMIAIGITLHLARVMLFKADASRGSGAVLAMLFCQVVLQVATLMAGCALTAVMLSANFGAIDRAALKLAGTALLTGSIASIAASLGPKVGDPNALIIAWHIVVLGYFFSFATLFELDLLEALTTTVIVCIVQVLIAF